MLFQKLNDLNFSFGSLELFSNCVCDRFQYVQIEDKKSSIKPMCFEDPQGSTLGPVSFNYLYVIKLSSLSFLYYYLPRIASSILLNYIDEMRVLPSLRSTYKGGLTEGLNSEFFDTKLNALTARPRIHSN